MRLAATRSAASPQPLLPRHCAVSGAPARSFSGAPARPAPYCTFAVTDAFALSVNVQLRCFDPPLEHAPDQIASRPFDTLNVIDVPVANDAEPLLPTLTLIPAGVELTRSPLRPLAVTVSVAVCDGGGGGGGAAAGDTVTVAVLVTPLKLAVIVTVVDVLTALVETVKTPTWLAAGTVTVDGTLATDALLLESETTASACATALSSTLPCAVDPPVIGDVTASIDSDPCGAPAGVTVSVPLLVVPL